MGGKNVQIQFPQIFADYPQIFANEQSKILLISADLRKSAGNSAEHPHYPPLRKRLCLYKLQ